MCGRFTLRRADKLKFDRVNAYDFWRSPARYNIAPTQPIWTVLDRDGEHELTLLQWGLIPSWSDKPTGFINARAESIDEKASFKESFQRRRCLIPADGFYEWEKLGKATQPHFFQMKDSSPFSFAGIWDEWKTNETRISSCAIVTTTANDVLATIHHRMPVILTRAGEIDWLDEKATIDDLRILMVPFDPSKMKGSPVTNRVNSADNDDKSLVEPIEHGEELVQRLLF
jgi:putative SOS response-associated peptidase YedK